VKGLILAALLFAGAAQAEEFTLPDPSIYVNLASNRTTVGLNGVYYGAPSQFAYVSECSKPDGPRYHCDIDTETNVTLYATDGSSITVTITAQFSATLLISGHNQWRQSQVVLNGVVTTP
jgi:hypothetical protein